MTEHATGSGYTAPSHESTASSTDTETATCSHTETTIDERDRRALQEYLTVLADVGRAASAEQLFLVVSQSGRTYLVDVQAGACECPDHEYRGERCKHVRRVEFATGRRPIPAGVDVQDDRLGEHVTDQPQRPTVDGKRVATDGGQVVEPADRFAVSDLSVGDAVRDGDTREVHVVTSLAAGPSEHVGAVPIESPAAYPGCRTSTLNVRHVAAIGRGQYFGGHHPSDVDWDYAVDGEPEVDPADGEEGIVDAGDDGEVLGGDRR